MKKKTMFSILLVIAGYFILGGILFNHIFKPARPDMAVYLNEIRSFESTVEGFCQEIKKVENGWAYCRLKMQAFAAGPPVHIHEHFDEMFLVEKGQATMLVNFVYGLSIMYPAMDKIGNMTSPKNLLPLAA